MTCAPFSRRAGILILTLAITGCASAPYRDFSAARELRPVESRSEVPAPWLILRNGQSQPEALENLLEELRRKSGVPAVGALVLRGDDVVAEGVAGVRRRGENVKATREDAFAIASCAKAMSATVVASLVQSGVLHWDRPVTEYFPDQEFHPDWRRVTLRHLLGHTAGVRDSAARVIQATYFGRGSLTERRARFAQSVMRAGTRDAPGARFSYCNSDYIVAAAIAEKASKTAWEELVHRHVFNPLSMDSAGFGPPGTPGEIDQPWGHGRHRVLQLGLLGTAAFDPGSRGADYTAMASPAGFVHSTLRDWAAFVCLHLRAHAANPNRRAVGLGSTAFDVLHGSGAEVPYAGGWYVDTRAWAKGPRQTDVGRVLFHFGQNGRWSSAVWIAPEIDFAVLAVCNEGNRLSAIDEVVSKLVGRYAAQKQLPRNLAAAASDFR
jgi:CubicO group peptidase (beta-lactamase class C family)